MSNRGILNGLGSESAWQLFSPGSQPILVANDGAGGAVQPLLNSSTVIARYRYDRQLGRVAYQGYIQFSSDATFGNAPFAYNVLLPYPCARDLGGVDLLIGSGYVSQGSAGNRFMPLRIVQSDPEYPIGSSANTSYDEDHYIQFFTEHGYVTGTGSIASGSTSTTITHNLNYQPLEADCIIVPTNNPTANPSYFWISSPTTTQFTVNCKINPSTSGANFSWKVIVDALLASQGLPLGPWAAGWILAWDVEYQARR